MGSPRRLMRSTMSFHSPSSGSLVLSPSSRHTTLSSPWPASISGASYRQGRVTFSITQSGLTLQKFAILLKTPGSSMGSSQRNTIMLGEMPSPCSSFTECCVGLLLCSPLARR